MFDLVRPRTPGLRSSRVVSNINTLIDRARTEGVPVVWVQHSDDDLAEGSDEWQYIDDLVRADDEPLVHRHYGDSFEETALESILAEHGVGRLVVTGAQTDACSPTPTPPRTSVSGALRSARRKRSRTPTSTGTSPTDRAEAAPR
jgi:nicotinamidase-related amidase